MIVLDTNVVSALMRPADNPNVIAWLDTQTAGQVWTSSVSIYEIRYGLHLMHSGRRRNLLEQAFESLLSDIVRDRVLPFDKDGAESAALLSVTLRRQGRNVGMPDIQIAGIVISRGATLATRNVKDFQDLDIPLIDPWAA